jgi:hypothetical protein
MELVYECSYGAELEPERLAVGPGPFGTRVVRTVKSGWCKGEHLNGRLAGAGGDWLLFGADGFGRIDVRAQLVTDDDAVIFLSYNGLIERNARVVAAVDGGETQFEDQYFRTLVRMETGAPAYAWVNTTLFVGRGRMAAGGVEYQLFRIP